MLLYLGGSHGHINIQNKEVQKAILVFVLFLITGVINIIHLVSNIGSKVLTGMTVALNSVTLVALVQILLFIVDYNMYKGEIPMFITILLIALLSACICIMLADVGKLILKSK